MPSTFTTTLADSQQPTLGNGVEDEVSYSIPDDTNNGDYRIQIRETGQTAWDGTATGFAEDVKASGGDTSGTIDGIFTGREDGEEYEVRARTETEDVTGAWTDPVSITTQFPGAANLTLSLSANGQEADLSWDDNSDNEDGFRPQRSDDGGSTWTTLADLAPNTTTYTDDTIIPVNEYEYRIEAYTEHTTAVSNTVTKAAATTQPRVRASGWSVSITHPVSGRVIRPDAINPDQVQYIPGPNTMPSIRLPVRRAPSWLEEGFDDNPDMTVHLDGKELPIDELVDVEQEEGQTILVGEGGRELMATVQAEYEAEERPTAATDLVSANTSYDVVDNTATSDPDTNTVQSPSGESELGNFISPRDDSPLAFMGGGLQPRQSCFTVEGENADREMGTLSSTGTDRYSNGDAVLFDDSASAEWDFTTVYPLPSGEFALPFRVDIPGDGSDPHDLEFEIDIGQTGSFTSLGTWGFAPIDDPEWFDLSGRLLQDSGANFSDPGEISADSHTLRISTSTVRTDNVAVDVLSPLTDARFSYTFDDTLNTPQGYLDGPETHPTVDAVFDTYESAFSIVGGSSTVTMNDTSSEQALALSNDFGGTYPVTASNSTTVDGDFPSSGAALNLRVTLSRYSPSGAQDATPRFGYDAQRLDAYELEADVVAESLLIDESFSNSLAEVLNQILGSQYGWTISNVNGTTTFTVDEPGSTVADRDPEISEASIQKRVQTYAAVTIKGSTIPVSGEQFQASTSFVDLAEDDILTGSEAVYDSGGTNYTRGVDYAIDYQAGEIRALSGGSLSTGTTYTVDYRHQIEATYNVPNATGDTLTRTVTGVVSDRQAEQIAYVLAEVEPGVSSPRYEGSIVVPRLDVTFDPLEGLELTDMDLPDVATPLSIRGEPQLTPLGLNLRLGSEPALEEALSNIRGQVNALADRS